MKRARHDRMEWYPLYTPHFSLQQQDRLACRIAEMGQPTGPWLLGILAPGTSPNTGHSRGIRLDPWHLINKFSLMSQPQCPEADGAAPGIPDDFWVPGNHFYISFELVQEFPVYSSEALIYFLSYFWFIKITLPFTRKITSSRT